MSDEGALLRNLVAANRILAREGVVDAFGHVSIRKPGYPTRYVMSRSRSPELVELSDLMEFELDGTAVDARGRTPYGERMIHGAIYEARPDIHSVVHNHSYDVLPFSVTPVRLRPIVHVALVIGHEVPVWDIRESFGDTDMLVRTMAQGRDMVRTLGEHTCLLMRGHGAVIAGHSLREAVLIAIYLQVNARIQLQTLQLGDPKMLSAAEVELTRATQFSPLSIDRVWEYFLSRVAME